ncbi:MAG TPA: 16S rRNA (adenine(1518)-N(6)/adenine(1519)-N(6))-dimethyltransferase RsmA [Bacteroidales bacterium]
MTIVKPKKSLGQHFLKDLDVAARIAQTLDAYKGMPILEIGPGMGVLTRFLLDYGHDLKVVELDRDSVTYLEEHFPTLSGRIIGNDFLKLSLDSIYDGPFCIIGNYPYNISSQILFKVLENKDKVPCCSGMFQKEVAERIASKPGKKAYGILSVLLQAYFDIEYLFTVDEHVFDPPPKVKSAVIRLTRNKRTGLDCNEILFKRVIKTGFNQRRKTLRNSLKPLLGNDCPITNDPIFNFRPEQLSVEKFVQLTNIVAPYVEELG